jgi:hypothetical protein
MNLVMPSSCHSSLNGGHYKNQQLTSFHPGKYVNYFADVQNTLKFLLLALD